MANKIYIPREVMNNQWSYWFNNHDIIVYTNNNCYYNYNNQYCDCYRIQTDNHYLYSNTYSCSNNNVNYTISYNNLTDDFYYRNDIADICLVIFIILLVGFGLPIALFSRFFRRLH